LTPNFWGSLSGLEYAIRLDIANALNVPLSAVLIEALRSVSFEKTQVTT
jgi:hypothetical protein